jgi:hypothetical protein
VAIQASFGAPRATAGALRQNVATGDLERGHNLALKAHLLSDELMKP